ncbi:hypothetical protein FHS19_001164 [Paenibacillus rhizosphaerae]|uniref:Copper amine oxidase-like N-terminal domain-containing protein n=1 Tax=Paenibacillus rhizosphaerae TaxID=297318 RepID=A0A839TLA6_9BACL|nr:hypothetical protein [Paenibacillus rhizosphaerae]MBB3126510.1 hypothetical protein [Paenibacillus rhizosphaerae]
MDKKHRLGTVSRSAVMLTILGAMVIPSPHVAAEDLAAPAKVLSIQSPSAAGQTAQVPAQKAAIKWKFSPSFYDQATGYSYYYATADQMISRTIYVDPEGEWHAFAEGITIHRDYNLRTPVVDRTKYGDPMEGLYSTVYDPSKKTATRGVHFAGGPDVQHGFRYVKNYYKRKDAQGKEYTASDFSLLLRTPSGVIREIERVPNRLHFKAMPDGNALAIQYSIPHKPYEISIINTETGKKKHLAYAQLDYYDAKGGRLLITLNKTVSPNAVYTLADGKQRPATEQDWKEFKSISLAEGNRIMMPESTTAPPAVLQPQDLPVTSIQHQDQILVRAAIGGRAVNLSFAFVQNGRTLFPVREIAEQTGLEVKQTKMSGKAGGTSFTMKGPGGSVSLTPTDNMMIGGQLFVGSDVLKRIGLPVQGVNWNP